MRLLKILAWVAGILVVLVLVAGIALWFGGGPVLAWLVEHPVSTAVGRQIRIGGKTTVAWGNPTRVTVEDVHVANASWGSRPDMFAAKRLEIELFVRTLIFAPTRIPLLQIEGGEVLLETDANEQGNWKFSTGTPKKRGEFPHLQHFVVKDSTLSYRNGKTKAETDLGFGGFDLQAPDLQSPVKLAADGTFQKLPFRLASTLGSIDALRNAAESYPVKLDGKLDRVGIAVEGRIAHPLDADGLDLRLSLDGAKLDELASALGVPFPELPDFRATSQLTGGNGSWALKAMTVKTGKSNIEGGLAIDTNAKVPHIQASLTSNYIDLADFSGLVGSKPAGSSAPAKAPDPSGRVLPDTKIEVQKLPGINLDLAFDGARIKSSGGLPFERVSIGLQIKDGTLTLKPLRFSVAKGDIDLNLHYTPFTKDTPPRLQGEIGVKHVDLHALLGGMALPDFVKTTGGIAGGFIKIDTTGRSVRDFLGRMNGDVGIFVENGQLSDLLQQLAPIDVLGALGVYLKGDQRVPVNCLMTRFDVKSGVATATTFLFDTPNTSVIGAGNINFESETLTLNFKPYNKSLTTVSLRTPVDISGTFKKPDYHLETGNLVARLGAAVGLGILFPPAAILPLVDQGLGDKNACSTAYAAQQSPGNPQPKSGSSAPPR